MEGNEQINLKILILHLLALGLYLLSSLILDVVFAVYYLSDNNRLFLLFISVTVANCLSFFEQLCLCNIIYELTRNTKKQEETYPSNADQILPLSLPNEEGPVEG